ncbi:TolC family protein [Candidatus Nitrosacidococcus tergens]|nr:TolC family protein [Candidatus Nitrosacidococcus tergens]
MVLKKSIFLALVIILSQVITKSLYASQEKIAQNITITQLVELVLSYSPGIKAQQAAVTAANYRIIPAGNLDDPTLSYYTAPATLGNHQRFSQQIEFSQPLPWPGKLALRKQVAEEQAHEAVTDEDVLRLQMATAAKTLYAEWFYVHKALDINKKHQQLFKTLQQVSETQYKVGRSGQKDSLQAQMAQARLKVKAASLQRQLRETQTQINVLLNRPVETLVPSPVDLHGLNKLTLPEHIEQLSFREQHPEILRVYAQIARIEAQKGLAEKNFYPDFQAIAGYNNFWEQPSQRWNIGLAVNLPINYGNKRGAALDAAQADLNRAQWQLTDEKERLLGQLETSQAAIEESQKIIRLYTNQLLPLTESNFKTAQANYRTGIGLFSTVIDAENEQLRTADELARADADYVRSLANLEYWLGVPLPILIVSNTIANR